VKALKDNWLWIGLVCVAAFYLYRQSQNIAAVNSPVGGGTP
jgi:hypothetical protein